MSDWSSDVCSSDLARAAAEENRRINAGVAAGDDEALRALPMGELIEELLFLQKVGLLEVMKACNEFVKAGHDGWVGAERVMNRKRNASCRAAGEVPELGVLTG